MPQQALSFSVDVDEASSSTIKTRNNNGGVDGPLQNQSNAAHLRTATTLEEKLELLESRFTEPSPGGSTVATNTMPTPTTLCSSVNNNNSNSYLMMMSSPSQHNGGGGDSRDGAAVGQINTSSSVASASQHSFGFDAPSLSNQSIGRQQQQQQQQKPHRHRHGIVTFAPAQQNNNNNNSNSAMMGFDAVRRAAEKHIAKVSSSIGATSGTGSNNLAGSAGHDAGTSTTDVSGEGNAAAASVSTDGQQHSGPPKAGKPPRKSVPVKKEAASVKENYNTNPTSAPKTTATAGNASMSSGSAGTGKASATSNDSKSKNRSRTANKQQSQVPNAEVGNITANNSNLEEDSARNDDNNTTTQKKRSRETVTTPPPSHRSGNQNSSLSNTGESASKNNTINKQKKSNHDNNNSKKKQKRNARIHDFFQIATATGANGHGDGRGRGTGATASAIVQTPPPKRDDDEVSSSPLIMSSSPSALTPASSTKVERLERRCRALELSCQDKEAQLQAVHNNRTILHSALQAALKERQSEVHELKHKLESERLQSRSVLEVWMTDQADREAKDLRERLAADGARLGRLVYTRSGLRAVERWEDGHAAKHVHEKKQKIQARIRDMETRLRMAVETVQQFEQNKTEKATAPAHMPSPNAIAGIVVTTRLEAAEAVESATFHLANLKRMQKEIEAEDHSLNEEKVAHIRELKRVALEDSSRFRSRPKVCHLSVHVFITQDDSTRF